MGPHVMLGTLRWPSVARLSSFWRYSAAPAATFVCYLLRLAFPHLEISPFGFFHVAVVAATLLGGLGPGLLAVALSAATAIFAFAAPRWGLSLSGPTLGAAAVFFMAASVIVLVCSAFRKTMLRVEESAEALRTSEARLRGFYEAGIVGVLYWTVDGDVTGANDKFLQMTGCDRRDLEAGRINWAEMTPPEFRHLDEHALRNFEQTGHSPPFEKEYIRKDGTRLPVLVGGAMLDDNRHEGVAFILDITERKRTEAAMREADRRKSDFLAVLSHELRNPLAAIRNSVYVLERKGPGKGPVALAREVIDRQSRHLTRLVDDLLDLSRIDTGKLRLQVVDVRLDALVSRIAEDYRESFASAGVDLDVTVPEEPVEVAGDPTRLSQMIGNVLANAAKFTQRGGRVQLSLSREASTAVVTVRDNGVGMSRELVSTIFEPFVQAERTLARSLGGLGLGLALTKALTSAHRGTIDAHSDGPGRGSAFVIRIPVTHAVSLSRPAERRRPRAPGPARRVLVIEDNPDAALSLKAALEIDGHLVEVALSGPEGLHKVRTFSPDVILCDLGLPGLDGYEVAKALRADPAAPTPGCLVALSGYGLPDDVERARQAGFDRHMIKPPSIADLDRLLAGEKPCGRQPPEATVGAFPERKPS